jgi:hypothetical protein
VSARVPRTWHEGPARSASAAYRGGVSPLAWLAIPLVALVVAIAWASWVSRPRGPVDPLDSVAAHHRFVEALERSRRESPESRSDGSG